jgi:hypothetical protein
MARMLRATTSRVACAACAVAAVVHAGCASAGATSQPAAPNGAAAALGQVDDSRWTWVEAECNDGPLDLARLGFEREVTLDVHGANGGLLLTFDTEIVTQGCSATSVWLATPAGERDLWKLEPQAVVAMPPDGECGARERDSTLGTLRMSSDLFEVVAQGSNWCRGFDARFVYRRAPARRLTARDVVTRYVAHFNRGDAQAIAELFVDSGSLIEPFTRTDDGNYRRHDGRGSVRSWYASAFAAAPWHALRLLSIAPGPAEGHVIADWEYMDAHLSAPFTGRNLFVVAGGEIYETEIQLVTDPTPRDTERATPAGSERPLAGPMKDG